MPAHIFTMLGLWEESIQANRESNAVIDPRHANDDNGGDIASLHAFDFIVYARLQLAQDRWVAADLLAVVKTGQAATLMKARYAIERADWKAAAEIPLAHDGGFDDVTARFVRALGAARREEIAEARDELSGLRALRAGIKQAYGIYWAGFVDIYAEAVDGWIAKIDGHTEEGLKRMQQAANLDDAREKNIAMENKLLPMRELLAEFLLDVGRPVQAGEEFAKSLENAPNRYRSLLGAARAAVAAGSAPKARDYYDKLLKLTLKADSRSPEVSEARDYLKH
jgi:tetratricopeptide (TPR) repeat protein